MTSQPELSLAVVSFNTCKTTLHCIKCAEDAATGISTNFIFVDNGSTDGSVCAVQQQYPHWKIIEIPENPGYGSALNLAFSLYPGRFFMAMNSDLFLEKNTLQILMNFLKENKSCGVVGPSLCFLNGKSQPSAKRMYTLSFALCEISFFHLIFPNNSWLQHFYYKDIDLVTNPWVDSISGSAMLFRQEAFIESGGFDEGFRMYFEEIDLCLRIKQKGYKIGICKKARAIHTHAVSTRKTSVREMEYYISYMRFFEKHYNQITCRIIFLAIAAATVARLIGLTIKYFPISEGRIALFFLKFKTCIELLTKVVKRCKPRSNPRITR
jgi:GT2 family glycosyltransferase